MKLNQSKVLFDQINHRYFLGDKELRGVTGILSRRLFQHKYDDVPKAMLEEAKRRGDDVHAECELVDSLGIGPTRTETSSYIALRDQHGLVYEWGEYLVSDNEHYASSIDKVYRVDESTFDLADIKTTYNLDEEYVSWQLSIYAWMFELQNPGAVVRDLFAIWLYKDRTAEIVKVDRKPTALVEELIRADIEDREFIYNAPVKGEAALPQRYADAADAIKEIVTQEKYWSDKKKEFLSGIGDEMCNAGVRKWTGMGLTFTRKEDSTRQTFDAAAFKKDHPDLYEKYIKVSQTKGSVIIKIE